MHGLDFSHVRKLLGSGSYRDGTVRPYVVEITSTPNTELVTRILHSLGLTSAYSRKEYGEMLRTVVRNAEAVTLPIFNEFTKGYRYQLLMSYTRK